MSEPRAPQSGRNGNPQTGETTRPPIRTGLARVPKLVWTLLLIVAVLLLMWGVFGFPGGGEIATEPDKEIGLLETAPAG